MKKIFSISFLTLLSVNCFATKGPIVPDTSKQQKWFCEIGMNLYNHGSYIALYSGATEKVELKPFYLNGVMFRLNSDKITFRFGLDYFRSDVGFVLKEGVSPFSYYEVSAQEKITEIRFGVEKRYTKYKIQPYSAMDIGLGLGNTSGVWKHDDRNGQIITKPIERIERNIGGMLSLGIRYQFLPNLSVNVEANVSATAYQPKSIQNGNIYWNTGNFRLNPLRTVGFNYLFN